MHKSADPFGVWASKYDSFRAMRKRGDSKAKRFESDDSKFGSEAKWKAKRSDSKAKGFEREAIRKRRRFVIEFKFVAIAQRSHCCNTRESTRRGGGPGVSSP